MVARTPGAERAAGAASQAAAEADPPPAPFARTRAALKQYRLDQVVDQEPEAVPAHQGAGRDRSATPRALTLFALGGLALATVIAAYLPFAGGTEDTETPDPAGEAALPSPVSMKVPPTLAAPATLEAIPAGPATSATPDPPTGAAPADGASETEIPAIDGEPGTRLPVPLPNQSLPARSSLEGLAASADGAPKDPAIPVTLGDAAGRAGEGIGAHAVAVVPAALRQGMASTAVPSAPVATARESGADKGSAARPVGHPSIQPVFRLQLVSVSAESAAQRAWEMYKHDFASLLAGLEPVIEPVEVGGRTMFRVQAGEFRERPTAENVCRQLREQGDLDCFVVAPSSGK